MPLQISISNSIGGGGGNLGGGGGGGSFSNIYSLRLDGNNDYMDSGSYTALDGTDTFSISMWVQIGTGGYVIGKNNTSSYWGYRFQFSITQSRIEASTGQLAFRNSSLSLGSGWTHVVLVIDRTESSIINKGKVYVNGSQITTEANSNFAQVIADSSPLVVGARQVGTASPSVNGAFDGHMDEVSIWSNALQPSDITTIYNSGAPSDISGMTGLINWWRMGDDNGGVGITVTDMAGSNNGTLENSPSFSTNVP